MILEAFNTALGFCRAQPYPWDFRCTFALVAIVMNTHVWVALAVFYALWRWR